MDRLRGDSGSAGPCAGERIAGVGASADHRACCARATAPSWLVTSSFDRIDLIWERTVESATKEPLAIASADMAVDEALQHRRLPGGQGLERGHALALAGPELVQLVHELDPLAQAVDGLALPGPHQRVDEVVDPLRLRDRAEGAGLNASPSNRRSRVAE